MKRIGWIGFVSAVLAYLFVNVPIKIGKRGRFKLGFNILFISSIIYLFFTCSTEFQNFMNSIGILNRFLLVDVLKPYFSFSFKYMGRGFGFVSYILPQKSIAGVYGLTAVHNDILKDFIELGASVFLLVYYYFFLKIPRKLFMNCNTKSLSIIFSLYVFVFLTLLTDNTFEYMAFMASLMILFSVIKTYNYVYPRRRENGCTSFSNCSNIQQ